MAAFANKEGGYIIFGVKDKPRTVVGLNNDVFESLDDEKIVKKLNELFAPEIRYERRTVSYEDVNLILELRHYPNLYNKLLKRKG